MANEVVATGNVLQTIAEFAKQHKWKLTMQQRASLITHTVIQQLYANHRYFFVVVDNNRVSGADRMNGSRRRRQSGARDGRTDACDGIDCCVDTIFCSFGQVWIVSE